MAQRQQLFGIHEATAYDPATKLPLGNAKILGQANMNFSGETVQNTGGSSSTPWSVEDGLVNTEVSITFKEYPNWLWEALNGATPIENAAEVLGAISSALQNVKGTSALNAVTGIASVGVKVGSEIDLKTGIYTLVFVTATTADIYSMTDVDFGQGTKKSYINDKLKINNTPILITSGGASVVPDFGIELIGGSGVIAANVGDTATFEVRAINTGSDEVVVGSSISKFKEIGLVLTAQRRSDGQVFIIDVFRAKGNTLSVPMTAKEFAETETPLVAFYDEARDGIYKMTRVRTTN
ncbi:MAG: hypothetical protein JKY93_01130 [Gammaproteobacteria bacterium]|nr:hypothetical protein [Gammaproteobacteria bacterium]